MLTAKQEKFCQEIVKGKSKYEAFINAGYATNGKRETIDNDAYKLTQKPEVIARIAELKKPIEEELQKELKYTAKESFKKLLEIQNLALCPDGENGKIDLNAGLKAEDLKQKLFGLQKTITKLEGELDIHNSMSAFYKRKLENEDK